MIYYCEYLWDQPLETDMAVRFLRIIPTYVGSTVSTFHKGAGHPNHSHAYGINAEMLMLSVSDSESFPRMWDQRACVLRFQAPCRIIPTHVGSTKHSRKSSMAASNHSHACGINGIHLSSTIVTSESFPRMWDQQILLAETSSRFRIIPTYVGSTVMSV